MHAAMYYRRTTKLGLSTQPLMEPCCLDFLCLAKGFTFCPFSLSVVPELDFSHFSTHFFHFTLKFDAIWKGCAG